MSIAQIIVDQAASAIKKYGTTVTLINVTAAYDEASGLSTKTEVAVSTKAVLEFSSEKVNSYSSLGIQNVTGVGYDIKAIFASADVAASGDVIVVGTTRYSVSRVDPIYAQDLIATYEVYGKRE